MTPSRHQHQRWTRRRVGKPVGQCDAAISAAVYQSQDTPVRRGGLFDLTQRRTTRLGADYAGAQPLSFNPDTSHEPAGGRAQSHGRMRCLSRQTRVGGCCARQFDCRAIRPGHLFHSYRVLSPLGSTRFRQGVERGALRSALPVKFYSIHHVPAKFADGSEHHFSLSSSVTVSMSNRNAGRGQAIGYRRQNGDA